MAEIEQESDYEMREKQLTAYKKLLEGQIDVIDSRLKMVERIDNNETGSKKNKIRFYPVTMIICSFFLILEDLVLAADLFY